MPRTIKTSKTWSHLQDPQFKKIIGDGFENYLESHSYVSGRNGGMRQHPKLKGGDGGPYFTTKNNPTAGEITEEEMGAKNKGCVGQATLLGKTAQGTGKFMASKYRGQEERQTDMSEQRGSPRDQRVRPHQSWLLVPGSRLATLRGSLATAQANT